MVSPEHMALFMVIRVLSPVTNDRSPLRAVAICGKVLNRLGRNHRKLRYLT